MQRKNLLGISAVLCLIIGILTGVIFQQKQRTIQQAESVLEIETQIEIQIETESQTQASSEFPVISETELLPEPTEISSELPQDILPPEIDENTLASLGDSSQLIFVRSSGSNAEITLFQKENDVWQNAHETSGFVGKNGVSTQSREGDYRTPGGLFPLGFAFGTESPEQFFNLAVTYRQIQEDCYWVDDPESEYYNQWVENTDIRWNSAEHLADYPVAYHYAVAINYNMNPVEKYKGSAIFLHCSTGSYTAGCVSVPQADMIFILY